MRKVWKFSGARCLKKSGSLIFCDSCDKIVGFINPKGYKYLHLEFRCTCENYGEILISACGTDTGEEGAVGKMPKVSGRACVCGKCNTPLFSVGDEKVRNYFFHIKCVCGEEYDRKPNFSSRLGETIKAFRILKENKSE